MITSSWVLDQKTLFHVSKASVVVGLSWKNCVTSSIHLEPLLTSIISCYSIFSASQPPWSHLFCFTVSPFPWCSRQTQTAKWPWTEPSGTRNNKPFLSFFPSNNLLQEIEKSLILEDISLSSCFVGFSLILKIFFIRLGHFSPEIIQMCLLLLLILNFNLSKVIC